MKLTTIQWTAKWFLLLLCGICKVKAIRSKTFLSLILGKLQESMHKWNWGKKVYLQRVMLRKYFCPGVTGRSCLVFFHPVFLWSRWKHQQRLFPAQRSWSDTLLSIHGYRKPCGGPSGAMLHCGIPPFNIQSVLYDIQYGIKNPTTRQQHKPSLKQMSARTRTLLKTARSEREMLQALQTVRVSNVHTWVQTKVKTVKNTSKCLKTTCRYKKLFRG